MDLVDVVVHQDSDWKTVGQGQRSDRSHCIQFDAAGKMVAVLQDLSVGTVFGIVLETAPDFGGTVIAGC